MSGALPWTLIIFGEYGFFKRGERNVVRDCGDQPGAGRHGRESDEVVCIHIVCDECGVVALDGAPHGRTASGFRFSTEGIQIP